MSRSSRQGFLSSSLAILALCGGGVACRREEPRNRAKPVDKKAEYRRLRERYDKIAVEQRDSQEGLRLRKRLSKATGSLIESDLPLGTPKSKVIETLGPPSGEIGDVLLYTGETTGFFHEIQIVDNKVTKIMHGYIYDIEGGR